MDDLEPYIIEQPFTTEPCAICGEEGPEIEAETPTLAAKVLREEHGWDEGVSEAYQLTGLMCPTCLANPDRPDLQ